MSVTPEQMRAFVERKQAGLRAERAQLHARAAADATRIVAMIAERYRPRRILQWGSVLEPSRFQPYSDIDVAVEGVMDPERFFAMLHDAEQLTRWPLDIVQLEHVEPEYRLLILEKGKVVYERDSAAEGPAE